MRLTSIIWVVLILGLALGSTACTDEPDFEESGSLRFSRDTVRFDTLFQNRNSPTQRLRVFNSTGGPVRISEIRLAGGEGSVFSLEVDGVQGNIQRDYELREEDSLYVFLRANADAEGNHRLIQEELLFRIGDQVQRVPIELQILNAYLYQDTVLPCDYTFPADTLIVVDGQVIVEEGCRCNILPGTEMYFTSTRNAETGQARSGLFVFGRLLVTGTSGAPILFTNARFGEAYSASPGDWNGIRFFPTSGQTGSNIIDHAVIENATIGIEVDSIATPTLTKLQLSNTVIQHMGGYGILGLGFAPGYDTTFAPMIDGRNLLVYNCALNSAACAIGGGYSFQHCTFAEYGWQAGHDGPALLFTNTFRFTDDNGQEAVEPFPGYISVVNSVVAGNRREEFGLDLIPGALGAVGVSNSLLITENFTAGNGNVLNVSPGFREQFNFPMLDFRPAEDSPLRGAGLPNIAPVNDLAGLPRDPDTPDIGAYNYTTE